MLIKVAPATLAPINTFIPTLASSGHKLEMITPYLPLSKEFFMSLTSTWDPGTLKMPCCWSPKRNKQKEEEEMPWTHQATGNMDDSPHCLSLSPSSFVRVIPNGRLPTEAQKEPLQRTLAGPDSQPHSALYVYGLLFRLEGNKKFTSTLDQWITSTLTPRLAQSNNWVVNTAYQVHQLHCSR